MQGVPMLLYSFDSCMKCGELLVVVTARFPTPWFVTRPCGWEISHSDR